jgi:hypothetical protein
MNGAVAETVVGELAELADQITLLLEQEPVIQAWIAGTLDSDRSFALQAQLYYHVAQTVPLLEHSARTCAGLAASNPMYAVLAQHYAQHAREESQPVPHELLLLDNLRRQGFAVDRLPPPCAAVQTYLARGFWAAEHAPLRELGRGYLLEVVGGQRLSPRLVRAQAARRPGTIPPDDFHRLHATADQGHGGHVEQTRQVLRELNHFPAFATEAGEVIAGAEEAQTYLAGVVAHVAALAP